MKNLTITPELARELHQYISSTPTGDVPFDRVFKMLAKLEQLEPAKDEQPVDKPKK